MDLYVGLRYNSFARLKEYFDISTKEMLEFWDTLSPQERKEWREANLYE